MGGGTSGTSRKQSIDVANYEEQRNLRIASRVEEYDKMYEKFSLQRARMIAESDALLLVLRWQAEEPARYSDQVRIKQIEIQRLPRVLQQADRNALESQNAARLAAEELAPAQAPKFGTVLE